MLPRVAQLRAGLLGLVMAIAGGCVSDDGQSAPHPVSPQSTSIIDDDGLAAPAPDELPNENAAALERVQAGRAFADQGDHAQALLTFEDALAIAPDSALANLEWGITAQMLGKPAKDIAAALERARSHAPKNPRAQFEWALFEESQGHIDPAIDGYRATLRLRADHARARARLGALRLQQGNHKAAVESLQIAVQLDPKPVPPRVTLAEAAEATGDVVLAAKMLRSLVSEFPTVPTWRQRLIALYDRAGQTVAANQERKALENAAPKNERKLRPLKKRRKRKRKSGRR